jgi:hypothetical protein
MLWICGCTVPPEIDNLQSVRRLMARSNMPNGLFLVMKNKPLQQVADVPFHDAGTSFKKCCAAKS